MELIWRWDEKGGYPTTTHITHVKCANFVFDKRALNFSFNFHFVTFHTRFSSKTTTQPILQQSRHKTPSPVLSKFTEIKTRMLFVLQIDDFTFHVKCMLILFTPSSQSINVLIKVDLLTQRIVTRRSAQHQIIKVIPPPPHTPYYYCNLFNYHPHTPTSLTFFTSNAHFTNRTYVDLPQHRQHAHYRVGLS